MGKRKGIGQQVEEAVKGTLIRSAKDAALVRLEQARQDIEEAFIREDMDALLAQRDANAAIQFLWDRREGCRDVANEAGENKVRAERRLGGLDRKQRPHGGDRTGEQVGGTPNLNVEDHTRAAWRSFDKIADETFDHYIELAREDQEAGISTAQIIRIARLGGAVQSTTFECYTPAQYVEAARKVLGAIDLDPASSAEANKTIKAAKFYTEEDNGLEQPWAGRVWLNPPYGRSLTAAFVKRAVETYEVGDVKAAILLLNAYGFDAEWFQPLFDHTLCFTDHRIKFYGGGPTFGSLFVYMGPRRDKFASVFSGYGAVLERKQ